LKQHVDVAIVGAGIIGLTCAYEAAERGLSVAVLERSPQASGASVRNFGMIWPIGQPPGPLLERALRSREQWLRIAGEAGFWHEPVGSLHVAYRDDELAVLEEFVEKASGHPYALELLSPAEIERRAPGVNPEGLLAGVYSDTEICVDPREAVASITHWLREAKGVQFHFSSPVRDIDAGQPCRIVAPGVTVAADRVFVCSGDDLRTLYPDVFANSGLVRCKLQMLRTEPQPGGWRMGPMLAGGLTLRHYASFGMCSTLGALEARIEEEAPLFNEHGIHVMASQNGMGEIAVGDSHHYEDNPNFHPFNLQIVDDLILGYLSGILRAPSLKIAHRWHGTYAKSSRGETEFVRSPDPNVWVVNGPGGAGMTFSFGLAQDVWTWVESGATPTTAASRS